jgi:type I restriction enzyme S subunit
LIDVPWEMVPLRAFAASTKNSFVNGPFGSDLLASELQATGVPVIYIRDINDGRYQRRSTVCVSPEKATQLSFCKTVAGDVLLSKVGDPPCEAALYTDDRDAIVTQDVIRIHPSQDTDPRFLVSLLNSDIGRREINRIAIEGTRLRVSLTDLRKVKLPQPTYLEQKRIGDIFEVWDTAIALTERRIEAARQRKKGLMQRLLTGRVRFPEFVRSQKVQSTSLGTYPEDWSIRHLSDVTDIRFSNVDKKRKSFEQPVLLCNYMDVLNNDYIHNHMEFMEASATDAETRKFSLKKDDVIITKDSETREEIAEPCVVVGDLENVVCGYHLAILRPKGSIMSGVFLKDILRSPNVHHQFVRFANGITRFGLNLSAVHNALVPVPPTEEQRKIATVLQACDREIEFLTQKRDALQRQKKGLMQRLLTGRVRVRFEPIDL